MDESGIMRKEDAEAAKLEKLKNHFLSNVSHELRTPLNGISGSVRLLQMMSPTAEQEEILASLGQSVTRMLHLVENVLLQTELDAGRRVSSTERFMPGSFLEELAAGYGGLSGEPGGGLGGGPGGYYAGSLHDVEIRVFLDESLPTWLEGDRENLGIVLHQFLDNAVKHTSAGHIHVRAGLCGGGALPAASPVGECLEISVSDTGIGIEPEVMPTLFEVFQQGDDSYTRRFQGAGLGLSICRRLASLMGGWVDVESSVGKGSLFRIRVPVKSDSVEERVDGRPRVLIVEEDGTSRILFGMFCELVGLTPVTVAAGAEGWDQVAREPFSLILMDIQMPVLSGMTLTSRIRAHEREADRHSVIIAVTAYALPGDRERFLSAGFDDLLEKPVDLKSFESTMRKWKMI